MGTVPAHDLKSRNEAALGTVPENAAKDAKDVALGPVSDNEAVDAQDVALARAKETTGTDPEVGQGGSLGTHDRPTQGLLPDGGGPGELEKGAENKRLAEDKQLADIQRKLDDVIAGDEVLRNYRANITVERAVEGLRIQIIDDDKREMFPLGSAELIDHTNKLFKTVADLIKDQPNRIAISGHTDSTPYRGSGGYSNWELSTDRANASRRALMAAGVPESRIARVVGKADTEPMDASKPEGAINRRISVVLLREGRPSAASAARSSGSRAPASLPVPRRDAVPPTNVDATTAAPKSVTPPPFAAPSVATPPTSAVVNPAAPPDTKTKTPEPAAVPGLKAGKPAMPSSAEPAKLPEPARAEDAANGATPEAPSAAEPLPAPGIFDDETDLRDNWLRLR